MIPAPTTGLYPLVFSDGKGGVSLAFVGGVGGVRGEFGLYRHRASDGALVALAYGPTREAVIAAVVGE